jgi:hypothetical protein
MAMSTFVTMMDSRVSGENGAMALTKTTDAMVSLFHLLSATAARSERPLPPISCTRSCRIQSLPHASPTLQVDLFFKLVRDVSDETLSGLFASALAEADTLEKKADLVVMAFQTRNCRGGKGERMLMYSLLKSLAEAFGDETVAALLPLLPRYGCYKDFSQLTSVLPKESPLAARCVSLYADALKADEAELAKATEEKRMPKLSLAAKYAPRENGKYDRALGLATQLALAVGGSSANKPAALRQYRKLVAKLNAALGTPEVLMAARRWQEIDFSKVASKCLMSHRKAFLNEKVKGAALTVAEEATGNRHPEDADRVAAREHLRAALLEKGVKGKQLAPHEIAAKCMSSGGCYFGGGSRPSSTLSTAEKDVMCAQWASMREGVVEQMKAAADKLDADVLEAAAVQDAASADGALASTAALKAALPKSVDLGKLVALVDVSGSMTGTPMEVAIGLGILVSELSHAAFRDRVLTFESRPNWVDLSDCADVVQKVAKVQAAGWGGSTDFEAACERILSAAAAAKLTPDEVPDLLVLSDMQFNEARGCGCYGYGHGGRQAAGWETHYERLQRRFAETGMRICGQPYAAPKVVFWNLRGNTVGFPVDADAPNTQMLSGFSPSLLKLVMSGADLAVEEEEQEVVLADGSVKKVVVKKSGPTPAETLRKALDDDAYDSVRLKLSELGSGPFADYTFAREDEGFEVVGIE